MNVLRMGLEAFSCQGLDMQVLSGLSLSDRKHILKCSIEVSYKEEWREEARARPKLEVRGD